MTCGAELVSALVLPSGRSCDVLELRVRTLSQPGQGCCWVCTGGPGRSSNSGHGTGRRSGTLGQCLHLDPPGGSWATLRLYICSCAFSASSWVLKCLPRFLFGTTSVSLRFTRPLLSSKLIHIAARTSMFVVRVFFGHGTITLLSGEIRCGCVPKLLQSQNSRLRNVRIFQTCASC